MAKSGKLTKEKANLIASHYCTNGYNKLEALLSCGYRESYARSGQAKKIYDKALVKEAIAVIEANNKVNTGYTLEKYQAELAEAQELAKKLNQPSAMVSAIVAKGRSCGYDKDYSITETEIMPNLTPEQQKEARKAAKDLGLKLSRSG